jgi:exodeoxyribonuclease-3
MIISSWNVNSVRARIENIKSYLLKYKPDIVMMQEIKTEDINFPYDEFSSMDYESHVFGQKSYNGVAVISKHKLKNIRTDLIKDKLKQSRIISAEVEFKKKVIQLINIYTPNGNPVDTEKYDYKKNWLDSLIKQLKNLSKQNENIILAGDFNIIPSAEDVYNVKSFEDDALYRLEIRKKLREMINLGFSDVYRHFNEDKEGYTFWDYMRGVLGKKIMECVLIIF